ncbi:MAG: sigma-70 family RNA polymerase sigma factor [bacterium]|nr:sigma-70 family RNA polymerase sigma factor [bacterium]
MKKESVNLDIKKLQQTEALSVKENDVIPEEVVAENMSLVESIAASIYGRGALPTGIEFRDLVSWGVEGLIKAYKRFDAEKGSKFKTYAYYRIRGEIFDNIRSEWQYRNPSDYNEFRRHVQEKIAEITEEALNNPNTFSADSLEDSINNIIANSSFVCIISLESLGDTEAGVSDDLEQDFFTSEKENILWNEINSLSREEQILIKLFYLENVKQKEIAKILKWSKSKVCRAHMNILKKLRNKIQKKLKD